MNPSRDSSGKRIRNFVLKLDVEGVAQEEGWVQKGPSKNTAHLPKHNDFQLLLCCALEASQKETSS